MRELGTCLDDYKTQLSEVRGMWEAIETFGLPQHLCAEQKLLGTAVSAWSLPQEIWSDQTSAKNDTATYPEKVVLFTLGAGIQYGGRLETIETSLRASNIMPPNPTDVAGRNYFGSMVGIQYLEMTKQLPNRMQTAASSQVIDFYQQQAQGASSKIEQKSPQCSAKTRQSFWEKVHWQKFPACGRRHL